MRKLVFIGLLILNYHLADAQRCNAEKEFEGVECGGGTGKCATMSANTDPNGKDYTYRWNCGDGKTETGVKVEHCYADYGVYHVSLDLIDKKTGDVVRGEVEKTLVLKESPVIILPARAHESYPVELKYSYDAAGLSIKETYWSYGDGSFGCGQAVHTYANDGLYNVKVLIVATLNNEVIKLCSETQLNVLPGNINGPVILDAFGKQERAGFGGKRFLEDDAYLALLDPTGLNVVVIKRAGSYVPLKPNTEYSLTAYMGNLYMPAIKFRAGASGTENESLNAAVIKMAAQPVDSLQGYRFLLDGTDVGLPDIQSIARFANVNPVAKINIGVYTHTGGRADRNWKLSLQRATSIKQILTAQGVKAERVKLFTSNEDMRLLNTCTGFMNCTLEDAAYNRKAEFRISY